jgi:outer membrane protein OmpA-like peptidoglycan-associated protein
LTRLATTAGSQAPAVGQLDLQGEVRPQPLDLRATLKLAGIDLRIAQPYLAPQLNLVLAGGKLEAEGRLELAQPARQPADAPQAPLDVHYAGRLAVGSLRTLDSVNGADFVAWQRLGLDGLDLAWQANALKANLGRIGLDGLNARLILHPDGHLNVADIVKRSPQAAPQSITTPRTAAAKAAPAASAPAATSATASPHQIRWQAIALRDGAVHFSDTFIKPNYSARLTRLQGSVSALSSSTPQPADVKIAGALDDGAPLSIGGRIHPLGARLFTDIEASARGIALTRLSTYAERYAGYAIEKGSLSVTLQYKIDQGRLEAQNQLFLDRLTFGNPVESAEATKLPVLLAVSLLKNRHGEIDLHLPVAGTLDDPQFSVGGIVWKLLLNLLEKAVTAPFALLMGGDSGETAQIDFAPGSAELSPAARERLDALAAKLTDRPGLKLEATGHADAQRDGAALQASTNRPAAAAAPTPARAGSAAAPTVPTANLAPALQALADRRADAVMAHLGATLPPERILITRSVVDATTAPAAADTAASSVGPGSTVQFKLR